MCSCGNLHLYMLHYPETAEITGDHLVNLFCSVLLHISCMCDHDGQKPSVLDQPFLFFKPEFICVGLNIASTTKPKSVTKMKNAKSKRGN